MAKRLIDILSMLEGLSYEIRKIVKSSGYDYNDGFSGLVIDRTSADELQLDNELNNVMSRLNDIKDDIEYISKPVKEVSQIRLNRLGRYETADGRHEFSCGCGIEYLRTGSHDNPYWERSSVEHDGDGYYIVGYRDADMDGLEVRFR